MYTLAEIGYEFAILTAELAICLLAVVRFAGVDLRTGRRRWVTLVGAVAAWSIAWVALTVHGSLGTFVPLAVGLPLVAAAGIVIGRLR